MLAELGMVDCSLDLPGAGCLWESGAELKGVQAGGRARRQSSKGRPWLKEGEIGGRIAGKVRWEGPMCNARRYQNEGVVEV